MKFKQRLIAAVTGAFLGGLKGAIGLALITVLVTWEFHLFLLAALTGLFLGGVYGGTYGLLRGAASKRPMLIRVVCLGVVAAVMTLLIWVHVRTHPLVYMETHAHCMKCGSMALLQYAGQNKNRFPYHPKGYGNALLLLNEENFNCLTGPGYDPTPFYEAKRLRRDLSEEECGRVYIQGLTTKCNYEIVLLFDKLPTPGGDHCHLPLRLWASLGREVGFKDGSMRFVEENDWPEFAREQVELLVKEGIDRKEAERLYGFSH